MRDMWGIVAIALWLSALATVVLARVRPWRVPGQDYLATLYLLTRYRGRHGAAEPAADPGPIEPWLGQIVGVDVCAHCAAPMNGGPCARCGWERPPNRAPFPPAPDPRTLIFSTTGEHGWDSGSGGATRVPKPPAAGAVPTQAVERTDGATAAPGAWRAIYDDLAPAVPPVIAGARVGYLPPWAAAEPEPAPPEPELPPHGDWLPGTGPPEDDPPGPPPSRLATAADADHAADLAEQDADAAEFIDRMDAGRRAYLEQLRRGFLAQRGLAYE